MEEKKSFNKAEYDKKFHRENFKSYGLKLSKKTDADIIDALDQQENKTDYIKKLIREDLRKN